MPGEREKETRFTELLETLQEGVCFNTPEGKLLEANSRLAQRLGYASKDELQGTDVKSLNFNLDDAPVRLVERPTIGAGYGLARSHCGQRMERPACVPRYLARFGNRQAKRFRYQGTLVDVTEHRKMERQLGQQEEFSRRLLESLLQTSSG